MTRRNYASLAAIFLVCLMWAPFVASCTSVTSSPQSSITSPVHSPASAPGPESPTPAHPPQPSPSPGTLIAIADEGRTSRSVILHPGECHARDGGKLQDPSCTPGSVDPAVTQATIHQTICVRGWTATVRPPATETSSLKFGVAYPAYSIPAGTTSELDHLVPLELGGSNDISNLWPEKGRVPNAKDSVEGDLKTDVCAGELTLTQARQAVAADWITVP